MNNLDELAAEYLAECCEHLATVEAGLLAIEKSGTEIDPELVNRVFRAMHSVKGGASFFNLAAIRELAQRTEDALALIRSRAMVPTPERVRVLLRAADKLRELIQDPDRSNQADISEIMTAMAGLCADIRAPAGNGRTTVGGHLRVLLVEDDFASRLVLQSFLSRYGECHIAVNGKEAVEAFRSSLDLGQRYDLICMDIMMPEMDGGEAVRQIRAIEESHGILSTYGARIVMTTAVDDVREVVRCFRELCDAYLIKPIDLTSLLAHMRTFFVDLRKIR
jgi:two-component system chemotaxis response regulator CheY